MGRLIKFFLVLSVFCAGYIQPAQAWNFNISYSSGNFYSPYFYSSSYAGYYPYFSFYVPYPSDPMYNQGQGFYEYSLIPTIQRISAEKQQSYVRLLAPEANQSEQIIIEKPKNKIRLPDPESIKIPTPEKQPMVLPETKIEEDGNVIIRTY